MAQNIGYLHTNWSKKALIDNRADDSHARRPIRTRVSDDTDVRTVRCGCSFRTMRINQ